MAINLRSRSRTGAAIEVFVATLAVAIVIALIAPTFQRHQAMKRLGQCEQNLKILSVALESYANDNAHRYPGATLLKPVPDARGSRTRNGFDRSAQGYYCPMAARTAMARLLAPYVDVARVRCADAATTKDSLEGCYEYYFCYPTDLGSGLNVGQWWIQHHYAGHAEHGYLGVPATFPAWYQDVGLRLNPPLTDDVRDAAGPSRPDSPGKRR